MAVNTLADKTITASAVALSTTSIKANWVILSGQSLAGAARVGDSLISTTRGAIIPSTGSVVTFPPMGNSNSYDLSTLYVIGTANDKLAICYGTN